MDGHIASPGAGGAENHGRVGTALGALRTLADVDHGAAFIVGNRHGTRMASAEAVRIADRGQGENHCLLRFRIPIVIG